MRAGPTLDRGADADDGVGLVLPGRADDAIAEYLEALRIDPGFADAHKNVGLEYARKGLMDKAEFHWRRALQINPGYADIRARLQLLDEARARPTQP